MFESRFLLASLHIEAILRGATVARRRKTLEAVKDGGGLEGAYGATLERIKTQDEENAKLAMAALTWVCHSERPLQVDELCNALAVEIGSTEFDPENIPSIAILLHFCQGLITVDEESSTVRLIHYTVQEYLNSDARLFTKPHSILAETCLTYLNSNQVKNLRPHSFPDHQSIPFLAYSSRYWGAHARRELSDHAKTLALELFGQYDDHVSAISLLRQVPHLSFNGDIGAAPLFSGLHGASFFGIVELVTAILSIGCCEINQQDCTGSTPLVWAARNGHVGAAKLLLGREDIDPNLPDQFKETPLGWAAVEGHEGVAELLLEREDIDPNRPGEYDETPLGRAALYGHEGVVKLLLEREGVDPNRPNGYGEKPLGRAAFEGHERVVKLLLGREDVDPDPPGEYGRTPLVWAALRGHEEVVKLLLEREGVDPNRPNGYGETPLGRAAFEGHEGVVKLLLAREDVDPDRPGEYGRTPLLWAAFGGHEGVVKLLLEKEGVDSDRPDKQGDTPLSHATRRGRGGVVQLLQALKPAENTDPQPPYPL